tara:strand:+ start:3530 stop:4396 length:867 start_codon:yes stop_codon:yes gene_type:complete
MIQSARQRRKKRQDLMGLVGIVALLVLGGGGYYFLQSTYDPVDEFKCSIKDGPKAVTAIIFDKSQMYTNDQVTDIKTSFNLWLAGNEATTKNRRIDLDFFQEGNLVQLYVTDENSLSQPDGLEPRAELCVPKDFRDANQWIENPVFLKADYDDFISKFSSIIEGLLEEAEGKSPIMETLIRISSSESFQKFPNVNHNIFIVSDMIQHSNNWTHYPGRNQGNDWSRFSSEMSGTVYMRPRLNQVEVQVFYAKRQSQRDKSIQTRSHVQFWEEFFFNANANISGWISIDG